MEQGNPPIEPLNSYEALAASIERALRTDLAPPGSAAHLAGSIDRIMLAEARAGELRIAYLRLVVAAPYVAFAAWAFSQRSADHSTFSRAVPALLSAAWLGWAATLAIALRRGWFRQWVPRAAPIADAAIILGIFLASRQLGDPDRLFATEALGYVIALCAFLSLSGALRLSRSAARTGTVLAVAVVLVASLMAGVSAIPAAAIAATLLATGLLSTSVTTLVRRVVTDEVARTTLSRMVKEAQETIDAREQVLKIVSHDLRNPLHTISMSASLLLDVVMPREQLTNHLQRVKRAGERMNRLIQDLLDVAKLEAGRVGIDPKPIDVAPLVREAYDMLAPLAGEKSIRLDSVVADGLPRITADGGRVLQVLSNLVGNAIKFTPTGGHIALRADAAPGGVRFSVADTGPGISPELLTKIFGQFFQVDPADRRGIGLGLTIAKRIVEAHGGRIWVESRPGQGTTFHFTLSEKLQPSTSGARERRSSEWAVPHK
jgi:signal transduction histidine kinase